jgi:hypothetical protein
MKTLRNIGLVLALLCGLSSSAFAQLQQGSSSITLNSGAVTIGTSPLNFTAGGTFTMGTTDAFSLILKTNGTTALTITSGQAATFAGTLTSTGAVTATSTITDNSIADAAVLIANGGHLTSKLGTGAAITSGTGAVTAGSTDNAGECTGGTSPVTITFGVTWGAKPMCACNDITSALGACKIVPNANGLTAVVTTTGTDSFEWLCVGK